MVSFANYALTAPLTGGRLLKNHRPGIITLIQTHADSLDFNCHLYMIVTEGIVDYTNPNLPKFGKVLGFQCAR